MQTIANDPYIKKFLQEVTPNQQIVTLKQLIYIGIKVVNNSLKNTQQINNILPSSNKQNQKLRNIYTNSNHELAKIHKNQTKKQKKGQKNQSKTYLNKYKHSSQGRIQSSLLREISKIRTQLQSLTNKVYDQCFQERDYCPSQSSMSLNNDEEIQQVKGFDHSNVPTFSANQAQKMLAKAFQKQTNNFFVNGDVIDTKNQNQRQPKINENIQQNRQKRVLSRHHLDDTEIRKALYREGAQEDENVSRAKSKSVMVQNKAPVRYFQEIDQIQTKQIKQPKKSRKVHNFDNNCVQTVKPIYKKNVKSKIKSLVQKDRLRYQENVKKQQFVKGFNKYEYSDNDFEDDQEQFDQNFEGSPQAQNQYEQQQRSSQGGVQYSENKSSQKFQFYGSNKEKQKKSDTFKEDFVQRQKQLEGEASDNINIGDNSSSFSQFSISGSSKREVGKISRRAPHS